MGSIRQIINPQVDELIRNRIGAILKDEIDCQYLQYNSDAFIHDLWIERAIPFSPEELPAVNVCTPKGDYENAHQGSSDGNFTFFIDVHTRHNANPEDGGDMLANFQMKRLLGICRYILADPIYKTLAFAPGFIMQVRIVGFEIKPHYKDHSGMWASDLNSAMGRLVVTVKANEVNQLIDAPLIDSHVTQLRLGISNKGYRYIYGNDSPSPPDTRYVQIVDQYGNVLQLLPGGSTYTVTVIQNIIDTITANQINITDDIIP